MVVMKCVRFPLNQRNFEGLLFERDLDICRETMKCSSSSTASDITCGVRLTMRESQLVAILRGAKSAFARIKALGPA